MARQTKKSRGDTKLAARKMGAKAGAEGGSAPGSESGAKVGVAKVAAIPKGKSGRQSQKVVNAQQNAGPRREQSRKVSQPKASIAAQPDSYGKAKRSGRPRRSAADAEAKRQRILKAALAVFSQHGFEAARLDEVARKAGVAKGTLYLYYPNKQAMFEAMVHSSVDPLLDDLSALARHQEVPPDELLETIFSLFRREVLETDRKLLLRLIIAEGHRFPQIARFYHREVISRAMGTLKAAMGILNDRGQLASEALLRYPQLIAAPLLLSVVWDALFARIDPLDVKGLLSAHAELMTTAKRRRR